MAAPGTPGRSVNLPLQFAPAPKSGYMAHGLGYGVCVDKGSVTLRVASKSRSRDIRERLVGANAGATVAAEQLLPGKLNLLIGRDRSAWRTGLPTYGKVHVKSAYPGIDVVYYGKGRRVQADYVVAPGADPNKIRLAFDGISGATVNGRGDLALTVGDGSLVKTKPVAYQMVGSRRVPVAAGYRVASSAGVPVASFELGTYDRSRTLVIDPILDWSGFFGSTGEDYIQGLTNNSDGYLYLVGGTASSGILTTDGAVDRSYNGGLFDVFVTKVRSNGSTVEYSTLLGGSGTDQPSSIAVASDMVTLCGDTDSTDWPATPGCFQGANGGGGADGFVATLNSTGTGLVASTYIGGSLYDSPKAVALQGGSVYIAGYTQSANYPTANAGQGTLGTAAAAGFLTKLNGTLTALGYSTYLRGTDTAPNVSRSTQAFGLAVDASGQATVVGRTNHTSFPTTPGALQITIGGSYDGFVTKFAASGSTLVFSTYLGGNGHDTLNAVKPAANGDYVVAGTTESTNLAVTSGTLQSTNGGGDSDGLVARLASGGATLAWCTYLGGSGADQINTVGVDNSGSVYVAGDTTSTNLPVSSNAIRSTISGTQDAFLAKIGATGQALLFGTYLGGLGDESAVALGESTGGDTVYVAGWTTGSAFLPATPLWTVQGASGGGMSDGFVMKLSPPNQVPSVSAVNRSSIGGLSVPLTGYLWYNTAGVAGKTLQFSVDGTSVGSGTTAATGRVDVSYSIPVGATLGAHPYTVQFHGDESYIAASGAATLTVVASHATALVADDKTATYGGSTTLTATLTYSPSAEPISNKTITFKIDGTSVGTGVTSAAGIAQRVYVVAALPGSRTILAEFAAEGLNAASSDTATLTVNHIATSTFATARTATVGTSSKFDALLRTSPGAVALSGKSVAFKVAGTLVGTDDTAADGWATYTYTLVSETAGNSYTVRADFAGDTIYSASYGTASMAVIAPVAVPTTLYASAGTGLGGTTAVLRALLRRVSGLAVVPSRSITFKVEGTSVGSGTTGLDGWASYTHSLSTTGAGSYAVRADFAGDAWYVASYGTSTMAVIQYATTTTASAVAANYGTNALLKARLLTSPGAVAVSGKTVTFRIDSTTVGTGTTAADGWAYYSYALGTTSAGAHLIDAVFAGDLGYTTSQGSQTLTINKYSTTVFATARSGNRGGTSVLSALLRSSGVALSGKTISFKVDGTVVGTGTTAGAGATAGWASYTYSLVGATPGSHPVVAEFAGDEAYSSSNGSTTMAVAKEPTILYTGSASVASLATVYLRGYLRDSANAWLADKSISFSIDGTWVGNATTNSSGVASYLYTATAGIGTHTILATFAGDASYAGDTDTDTLTVTP